MNIEEIASCMDRQPLSFQWSKLGINERELRDNGILCLYLFGDLLISEGLCGEKELDPFKGEYYVLRKSEITNKPDVKIYEKRPPLPADAEVMMLAPDYSQGLPSLRITQNEQGFPHAFFTLMDPQTREPHCTGVIIKTPWQPVYKNKKPKKIKDMKKTMIKALTVDNDWVWGQAGIQLSSEIVLLLYARGQENEPGVEAVEVRASTVCEPSPYRTAAHKSTIYQSDTVKGYVMNEKNKSIPFEGVVAKTTIGTWEIVHQKGIINQKTQKVYGLEITGNLHKPKP